MNKTEQKAAIAAFKLVRKIVQGTIVELNKEYAKIEDKSSSAAQRLEMSLVCYNELEITMKQLTRFDNNVMLAVKEEM